MRFQIIEELNRQGDKIIPVSGHHRPSVSSRKGELFIIGCFQHPGFMSADRVRSLFSQNFGDLRADIFIQVKLHVLPAGFDKKGKRLITCS